MADWGAEAIWDIVDRQERASRAIIYGLESPRKSSWCRKRDEALEDLENRRFCGLDRSSGKLVRLKKVEKHMKSTWRAFS